MASNGLKPLHIFLLTLAGCLLVAGLWYTFSYQTKQTQMSDLKMEIETAEAQAAQYRQAQASLPALREEVATLEEERSEFVAALPQTTQMANILTDMRRTAEETGVIVEGIDVTGGGQESLPGGVRPIKLNIAMNGTYSEAFKTLQRLETLGRFSTVDSLGLNILAPTSQDPELDGDMTLTMYTFDPSMSIMAGAEGADGAPAAPAAPAPAAPTPVEGGE